MGTRRSVWDYELVCGACLEGTGSGNLYALSFRVARQFFLVKQGGLTALDREGSWRCCAFLCRSLTRRGRWRAVAALLVLRFTRFALRMAVDKERRDDAHARRPELFDKVYTALLSRAFDERWSGGHKPGKIEHTVVMISLLVAFMIYLVCL